MDVWKDTFVPTEVGDAWFATRDCPACLQPRLVRIESLLEPHWVCSACDSCFRAEHGRLLATDPLRCAGCLTRSKAECLEALRERRRPGPDPVE